MWDELREETVGRAAEEALLLEMWSGVGEGMGGELRTDPPASGCPAAGHLGPACGRPGTCTSTSTRVTLMAAPLGLALGSSVMGLGS